MYRVFNPRKKIMTTLEITPQETMVSTLDAMPSTDEIITTAQGFSNLNLSENMLKALSDINFSKPSSIQAEAIPQIIRGIDIIAQAPTGSGKTAAYAIPVLEKLDMDEQNRTVQALILCPTRELAMQVHREFEKLSKYMENVSVVSVYGGQNIEKQLSALRKSPQIVVATPGRLMDHLRRGSIKLTFVKTVVLDEADEMLDMGFREDIHTILEDTSVERQTVLFSATMAKDIIAITKKFQKSPNIIDVTDNLMNTPNIKQLYFVAPERDRIELLTRLLDLHNVKLALVFCNTKSNVDRVVEILKVRGYFADALHGDMNQAQREKVMRGFRNGGIEILVATDVAGRGIDVKNVEAVFNYDLPRDDEDYVHRIGRTARAGKSGVAFTFITRKQVQNIKRIERANGVQILNSDAPSVEEIETARVSSLETEINEVIKNADLSEFTQQINSMVNEETNMLDIAAALLKLVTQSKTKKIDKNVTFDSYSADERDDYSAPRRNRTGRKERTRERDRRGGFGNRNRSNRDSSRSSFGSRDGFSRESSESNQNETSGRFEQGKKSFSRNNSSKFIDKQGKERKVRKEKVKLSLDDMIKSVKSLSEPQKRKFPSKKSFSK